MHVHGFTFNPFEENTYLIYDDSGEAIVVDPGCSAPEEEALLHNFITTQKLTPKYIVNTHGHIDHVIGNAFATRQYDAPLLLHPRDEPTLRAVKAYAAPYGFPNYQEVLPDRLIDEGDKIAWGDSAMEVLFLPGHAPGHIGLWAPDQKILIGGDVLFKNSIGRTDLPGGDTDTLLHSIRQKLFALPDDTLVYAGHGPTTTIGEEKINNPFCRVDP